MNFRSRKCPRGVSNKNVGGKGVDPRGLSIKHYFGTLGEIFVWENIHLGTEAFLQALKSNVTQVTLRHRD